MEKTGRTGHVPVRTISGGSVEKDRGIEDLNSRQTEAAG
jgi:hypothetical protein